MTPLVEVLNDIAEAYLDAQEENWDGYGGKPAEDLSMAHAVTFVRRFGENVPGIPLPSVHPNGHMGLEWITDIGRMIVSFGEHGGLAYAVLYRNEPDNHPHGDIDKPEAADLAMLDKHIRAIAGETDV